MPRFFVDLGYQPDEIITLPAQVARHMQVLRLQPGDPIVIFNGQGGQYEAVLIALNKRDALVQVGRFNAIEAEPPYRVTLAQGIASGDKMDWLLEKAIELGVSGFVPLSATRSVVRLTHERAERRHTHWQEIARASCEQCGRNRIPAIAPPIESLAWLAALPASPEPGEMRLLLSPRASTRFSQLPQPAPSAITLLIGPEGGLSPEEEALARERGFLFVGLGPRILRTETAGIAMLAALAARWDGW